MGMQEQEVPAQTARVLGFTMLGSAIVVALGCLLPWATAVTIIGQFSVSGTSTSDGKILLAAAFVVGVPVVVELITGRTQLMAALAMVGFMALVGLAILEMHTLPTPKSNFASVQIGIGLWLNLIGGVVGFVASLINLVLGHEDATAQATDEAAVQAS